MDTYFYLPFLLYYASHVTGYSYTGERSIRSSVLNSFAYDNMARPNDSTTAYFGFNLLIINDVDIDLHRFVCTGWFTVLWNDDRLTWRPEIYDDTTYIHALENELWKPEVLVLNAQENVGLVSDDHLIYRIHNTGNVEWEPLMTLTVHCDIDVTYYPFDTQRCQLELTGWGLPTHEMNMKQLSSVINTDSYQEGPSWNLLSTRVRESFVTETLNGTTESFSQIIFEFTMQRKAGNYVFVTIVPIVISSFLMPCSMLLPVACTERVTSGFLVLVVNAVLMTIFTQQIPDIATTSSVLGFFVAGTFILDNVFLLMSVILASFYYKPKKRRLGQISAGIIRFLLRITCFHRRSSVESNDQIKETLVFDDHDVIDIPTDDLKKIHRACADGAGTCAVNRNWMHPSPTFENGFTEHVTIHETKLPAIYPDVDLNLVKLHKLKSSKFHEEKARAFQTESRKLEDHHSDENDDDDALDNDDDKKAGTSKMNNREESINKQKHIIDEERAEKGKLYLKKLSKDNKQRDGKDEKTLETTSNSASPSSAKYGISYQTAVMVFDRLLFVMVVGLKVLYNVILIGNLVSELE